MCYSLLARNKKAGLRSFRCQEISTKALQQIRLYPLPWSFWGGSLLAIMVPFSLGLLSLAVTLQLQSSSLPYTMPSNGIL
jgi:hypothetical protein